MINEEEFWDQTAKAYVARPISNMQAYEMTMDRTRHYLNQEDKVLELGCGSGNTALLLAPNVKKMWASDISAEMFSSGIAKAKEQNITNVEFLHGGIDSHVLESHAPYDAILAFNLIHLLKDPADGIRRIGDLVKPGGLVISKTGCLSGMYGLLRFPIKVMQWMGKAPHVTFLSHKKIEALFIAQGFEVLEAQSFPKQKIGRFIVARKR